MSGSAGTFTASSYPAISHPQPIYSPTHYGSQQPVYLPHSSSVSPVHMHSAPPSESSPSHPSPTNFRPFDTSLQDARRARRQSSSSASPRASSSYSSRPSKGKQATNRAGDRAKTPGKTTDDDEADDGSNSASKMDKRRVQNNMAQRAFRARAKVQTAEVG